MGYLQLLPGTDVALLMGMMKIIIDENLQNNAFINHRCENYEVFKKSLSGFDLNFVETTTQVPKQDLIKAARIYAQNSPASILYAMGITVPFIFLGALIGFINNRFLAKMIKYGAILEKFFALILVWMGIEIILSGYGIGGLIEFL